VSVSDPALDGRALCAFDDGGAVMQLSTVVRSFLDKIRSQEHYDQQINEGSYLGFYVPGAVILKRVECLLDGEPPAVAYSLNDLFSAKTKH
jgi:hypothetical protein